MELDGTYRKNEQLMEEDDVEKMSNNDHNNRHQTHSCQK